MKVSEMCITDVMLYCRADSAEEEPIFSAILEAGKQFIQSQTGLTAEECDEKPDLSLALLILCAELYDNRSYSMETGKIVSVNPAVKAIIDQYCRTLL